MALPVNFNVHTRRVHVVHIVPMIVTIALMHIHAWSARHALAFTEAVVTHLPAHAIRVGGNCQKGCNQPNPSSAHQHRPHLLLSFFLPAENAFRYFFVPQKKKLIYGGT
jgi:hypothetical protein